MRPFRLVLQARPLDLPVNVKASANPVLKLRKKVQSNGHDIKLGVDYDVMESSVDIEASTDAKLFIKKLAGEETADQIGGEIALKMDNVGNGDINPKAEFRRKWLLPGIAGFKTKMEFLACADLAGASDAKCAGANQFIGFYRDCKRLEGFIAL